MKTLVVTIHVQNLPDMPPELPPTSPPMYNDIGEISDAFAHWLAEIDHLYRNPPTPRRP